MCRKHGSKKSWEEWGEEEGGTHRQDQSLVQSFRITPYATQDETIAPV